MAYPTTAELTTYLGTMGVTDVSGHVLQDYLDTAADTLCRLTGRQTFNGDASTSDIRLRVPPSVGNRVLLEIPDMWSLSTVKVGWDGSTGTTLTEWTDYWTLPDGSIGTRPYECIEFASFPPGDVLVTGKLGYASTPPDAVNQAILARAASIFLVNAAGSAGGTKSRRQGDRSIEYDVEAGRGIIDRLQSQFSNVALTYTRFPYF